VTKSHLDSHPPDMLVVFAYEYFDDIRRKNRRRLSLSAADSPRGDDLTLIASNLMHDDVNEIVENLGADAQRFAGKTLLLSGGAGFLGRHFIALFRRLNRDVLDRPCKVISADNYITGEQLALHDGGRHDPNIVDVWADVSYPLPVREDLHFIIHAAGVASPVYYMKYPLETIESAIQGSKNLLELARTNPKLEGYLFFSSKRNLRRSRSQISPRRQRPIMATYRASGRAPATTNPSGSGENNFHGLSAAIRCAGEDRPAVQRLRPRHEARRSARGSDVHL